MYYVGWGNARDNVTLYWHFMANSHHLAMTDVLFLMRYVSIEDEAVNWHLLDIISSCRIKGWCFEKFTFFIWPVLFFVVIPVVIMFTHVTLLQNYLCTQGPWLPIGPLNQFASYYQNVCIFVNVVFILAFKYLYDQKCEDMWEPAWMHYA